MNHRHLFFCSIAFAVLSGAAACDAQPRVAILTQTGREVVFQVEVADTPGKRELGLQYRKELGSNRGMIFLFASEAPQTFWMKNTPIPLDMIFINRDRKIVGIVEHAVPYSLESRSVGVPSQYVLEINGGLAKRQGIKIGDPVRFEKISTDGVAE
ncbi:MAG TPA: DUF192 domain-containing protein [Candidatus Binatia bacterium]|jgi:uncharacterized membrane protein (UPF0127 family)